MWLKKPFSESDTFLASLILDSHQHLPDEFGLFRDESVALAFQAAHAWH
jgi:hypothetical protein